MTITINMRVATITATASVIELIRQDLFPYKHVRTVTHDPELLEQSHPI